MSQGAKATFLAGFNCAEAVSLALCQALGINGDAVPKMATGFGGGGGGCGGTCGALAGAMMTVGLKFGRSSAADDRRPAYEMCQHIYRGFVEEMGASACGELTGLDLSTPEGTRELRTSGTYERVCTKAVEVAERLALEQLRLQSKLPLPPR